MENQNKNEAGFSFNQPMEVHWFHIKGKMKIMWNGCNFRVITIILLGDEAFPIHGPVNWSETGGHKSKLKVELA